MIEPFNGEGPQAEIIDLNFHRLMSDIEQARPVIEHKQAATVLYFVQRTQVPGYDTFYYEELSNIVRRMNPNPPFGSQSY